MINCLLISTLQLCLDRALEKFAEGIELLRLLILFFIFESLKAQWFIGSDADSIVNLCSQVVVCVYLCVCVCVYVCDASL